MESHPIFLSTEFYIKTMLSVLLHFTQQPLHPRAVIPLCNDTRQINHQSISQHHPWYIRRSKEPENPKRKYGQPMCQFPSRRFNKKSVQVFRRKIIQMFLFKTSFLPNRSAIRQQMLPPAYMEYPLINASLSLKTMGSKKERGWR